MLEGYNLRTQSYILRDRNSELKRVNNAIRSILYDAHESAVLEGRVAAAARDHTLASQPSITKVLLARRALISSYKQWWSRANAL